MAGAEVGVEGSLDIAGLIQRTFDAPGYEPPVLPSVAFELNDLTRQPDIGFERVVEVLQQDAFIASRVLRVAQSPAYGSRVPVGSIRDAVQRLGLRNVRDIVWQVAMDARVFRSRAYAAPLKAVRAHCLATAHLARVVGSFTEKSPEEAFLCGLLHDVGIAAILVAVAEAEGERPPADQLWPSIDRMHVAIGARVAQLWQLSPVLQAVIRHHHEREQPEAAHMLGIACVAEDLATELGYGLPGRLGEAAAEVDQRPEGQVEVWLERLELDPQVIPVALDKGREVLERYEL